MSRRIITFIFIVGIIATFFLKPQSKSNEVLGMPNFTVITRTSTPTAIPPTATPKDDDDDGGSNPPPPSQPTETAVPANTPTSTLIPVTLVSTPIGGFLPTAVACGFPPTVQAKNTTRIRLGPGTDYQIIGQLLYLETRPIIGRGEDAQWWIIQLNNNQTGWVSNAIVNISGNTNGVPIIQPPPINGNTPTPGPFWNPTPNPECPTLTPSPTPPPTKPAPTKTATSVPEPSATNTPMPSATPTIEILEETAAETEPTATATSVVPSGAETAEAIVADTEPTTAPPTAAPLDEEETPNAVSVLPCAPALIGMAVIGFLAFRRIF
jgi:hypothetical protein